jgi:hypothetical protein
MSKPKKYIFINGVMQLNPQYTLYENSLPGAPPPTHSAHPTPTIAPLGVVSCFDDLHGAVNESGVPIEIEMPQSTTNSIQFMKSDAFNAEVSGGSGENQNLFEGLCEYFVTYEVPIGLLTKLMELRNYRLNFMVDDSGLLASSFLSK